MRRLIINTTTGGIIASIIESIAGTGIEFWTVIICIITYIVNSEV